MLSFVVVLSAGCATSGSYCKIARPITWGSVAELDATPLPVTRQIVRHNEIYEVLCEHGGSPLKR